MPGNGLWPEEIVPEEKTTSLPPSKEGGFPSGASPSPASCRSRCRERGGFPGNNFPPARRHLAGGAMGSWWPPCGAGAGAGGGCWVLGAKKGQKYPLAEVKGRDGCGHTCPRCPHRGWREAKALPPAQPDSAPSLPLARHPVARGDGDEDKHGSPEPAPPGHLRRHRHRGRHPGLLHRLPPGPAPQEHPSAGAGTGVPSPATSPALLGPCPQPRRVGAGASRPLCSVPQHGEEPLLAPLLPGASTLVSPVPQCQHPRVPSVRIPLTPVPGSP